MKVIKEFHFEASHSLPSLPEGHKCRNLHGHSYRVRIECESDDVNEHGFVIDYADISDIVTPVVKVLDHRFINEVLQKDGYLISSAEILAVWFWNKIQPSLPLLSKVSVSETRSTWVEYEGP